MNPLLKEKSRQMETVETRSVLETGSGFCLDAIRTVEDSRINSTDSNFPNMQSLTESLPVQEEMAGCAVSEGHRDVHESGQELGFSHPEDPEEDSRFLNEENRRLKEARTCKICRVAEVNVVILPCGHLVRCTECTPGLQNCPVCRQKIRGTVRTFLN